MEYLSFIHLGLVHSVHAVTYLFTFTTTSIVMVLFRGGTPFFSACKALSLYITTQLQNSFKTFLGLQGHHTIRLGMNVIRTHMLHFNTGCLHDLLKGKKNKQVRKLLTELFCKLLPLFDLEI